MLGAASRMRTVMDGSGSRGLLRFGAGRYRALADRSSEIIEERFVAGPPALRSERLANHLERLIRSGELPEDSLLSPYRLRCTLAGSRLEAAMLGDAELAELDDQAVEILEELQDKGLVEAVLVELYTRLAASRLPASRLAVWRSRGVRSYSNVYMVCQPRGAVRKVVQRLCGRVLGGYGRRTREKDEITGRGA